jgi:hypothetical protein
VSFVVVNYIQDFLCRLRFLVAVKNLLAKIKIRSRFKKANFAFYLDNPNIYCAFIVVSSTECILNSFFYRFNQVTFRYFTWCFAEGSRCWRYRDTCIINKYENHQNFSMDNMYASCKKEKMFYIKILLQTWPF